MPIVRRFGFLLGTFALLATAVGTGLFAQNGPIRVRGAIEKVDENGFVVRTCDGNKVRVYVGGKTDVIGLEKITLSDIEPNAFVGVAATPRPDGL